MKVSGVASVCAVRGVSVEQSCVHALYRAVVQLVAGKPDGACKLVVEFHTGPPSACINRLSSFRRTRGALWVTFGEP